MRPLTSRPQRKKDPKITPIKQSHTCRVCGPGQQPAGEDGTHEHAEGHCNGDEKFRHVSRVSHISPNQSRRPAAAGMEQHATQDPYIAPCAKARALHVLSSPWTTPGARRSRPRRSSASRTSRRSRRQASPRTSARSSLTHTTPAASEWFGRFLCCKKWGRNDATFVFWDSRWTRMEEKLNIFMVI